MFYCSLYLFTGYAELNVNIYVKHENWKVQGRKISWLALCCYPRCLCGVTKENHKTLNSDNSQPARKLLNLAKS